MRAVVLERNRKRPTVPSKILPSSVIMVLSDSRNIRVSIKSPMMSTSYQGNVHNLPDALEHNCSACSEKQKEIADKISHYLIDHKAEEWSLLEAKYDATGAYRQRYLQDRVKEKSID
ncbi:putative odorant-binding protein A10 isoform X2 [Frieseomelitta varia]|uniref:putative odorant-binding protein A10 isoform X2 n=1 Tax=Frieseomelitta varia TaxID=561572 RepID=UPI001CB6AD28|nr:putative odorant-binding protein A10 isoform X2 [Frieseomelitta varia]